LKTAQRRQSGRRRAGTRWRLFDFGRIDAQTNQAKGQDAEMLAAYRLAVYGQPRT
jgi:outer membrane protein TolC